MITAFNFPCAVLGWNLAIAMICGDLTVWKGASTTSLVTLAVTKVIAEVLEQNKLPEGILTTVIGPGRTIGEKLINDKRLELISFTGSSSVKNKIKKLHSQLFCNLIKNVCYYLKLTFFFFINLKPTHIIASLCCF